VIIPLDLTQLFSRFHARCRSPFQLHNHRSWLLRGSTVESLQSHCILTMSHWSSGLPVCFLSWGARVQFPGGYLCETGILLLALSCYKENFLTNKQWFFQLPQREKNIGNCFNSHTANGRLAFWPWEWELCTLRYLHASSY
jgi:hypothetical protein